MQLTRTTLPGVVLVQPQVFTDARGRFAELHKASAYAAAGIGERFVQDNVSVSAKHTLRGLHFQHPNDQGKLVTCLRGAIVDVAVDIRRGSPTWGQHVAVTLTADAATQLWIPAGFAHGFCALEDDTVLLYKCTAEYDPASERSIRWDDPALGIAWPTRSPLLSAKDAAALTLAELEPAWLPVYAG
jgi:dTDP-4-dehydrorhamnose 3,5-epimerase